MNFNWSNPYRTARTPVFARNLVATSQPLAAQAGLHILRQGGNAVDAAIAAAAVLTITEPCSNGLGSDCFAIVWDPAGRQLHGLNSSGTAPAAWTHEYFHRKYGGDPKQRPTRGWDAVTVPGAVAGWSLLHGKLGRLAFDAVLAPAIDYAHRGYAVSPIVQDKWRMATPVLRNHAGFAQHFLPKGRPPEVGEHFVLAGAEKTLKLIARGGAEAFYLGEIAEAIGRYARETGGAITAADFADYWRFAQSASWVGTISTHFHGHELHEIPPNGQGIAALACLGILRHTAIAELAADSIDWQHTAIEAMKLAFADAYAHVADPRSMTVGAERLLDDGYLAARARLIDPRRAQSFSTGIAPRGGTVYLTTADASGMMVSFIQSNYMGFGSGVVVPGYGISLQNRGAGFSLDARSPNCVAPGRRPFHTIIPGFLTREGQPQMSFGVMGGNMQPQGHVQTLLRMLLAGQQPQAACDAPRWKVMQGLDIEIEGTLPVEVSDALAARGHAITRAHDTYMDFGSGQFIWRLGDPGVDGYVAASDPRRDGQAAGF